MQECLLEDCDPSLISIQILYENQLNIEQFKDFLAFKNIVELALRNSLPINYIFTNSKHLKEKCLDIASKNGFTEFVRILLGQGVKLNRVNRVCNRAPIHFATEGGHVDTLEALLAEPTVNPNLQAGQQTALHIAVNRNDQKCALVLLQKGASANIPNSEGLTAIYLAATKKQCDMVMLILQKQWQSLDPAYRNRNNQTIWEVIQQNLPDLKLEQLNKYQFCTYDFYDLQYYLIVNDETNFLKNMPKETFLSMTDCSRLLKIAIQNDLRKAIREILKSLKEIEEDTKKFFIEQAARVAIEKGHYAVFQELLNVVPETAKDLIIVVCCQLKRLSNQGTDTRLHISDWLECMNLMLDKKEVNIHEIMDEKRNTPLHYAAKSGYSEVISLFLNRDCYIGHLNDFNKPPIADIPDNILSNYFDNCIQMKTDQQMNKCAIEFNYRCLMPSNVSNNKMQSHLGTRELEVFMYIANNDYLKHLLKHPLLSSFLHLKWHRIRYLLFVNFIFYAVFYILINTYILSAAYSSKENETFSMPLFDGFMDKLQIHENILQFSIVIMLSLHIFRDSFLFLSCPRHYVNDLTNCLQIAIIALSIWLLVSWQLNVGVAVILLSSWKLMLLISQHPRITTSIVIFQTVFYDFVCLISPYIFLILVFALVFKIFFKDSEDQNFNNSHQNLANFIFPIMKTIIMLTGEFDIDDITFKVKEESIWFVRFVFVIFVLLMVIVLMSMINGMAVSDTTEILCKAELFGLIERIRLLAYFENSAYAIGRRWSFGYKLWWKSFGSLASRIFLFQYYLRDGKISIKIEDSLDSYDDNDIYSNSKKNNEYCPSWKMDDNIIKRAKLIIFNKNQQSDNEKIITALNELQEAMGIARTKI